MRCGLKVRGQHQVRHIKEYDLVKQNWVATANSDGAMTQNTSIRGYDVIGEIPIHVQRLRTTHSNQLRRVVGGIGRGARRGFIIC